MIIKCDCPVYCKYCGAKRRRDSVGHYCPTKNCQWHHGYSNCRHGDDVKLNVQEDRRPAEYSAESR